MLADIINQLRGHILSLPHYKKGTGKFVDEDKMIPLVSELGLDITGYFHVIKNANDSSVSYHGNLVVVEYGDHMIDRFEESDDEYKGIKSTLVQIKQNIEGLVKGTDYKVHGLQYHSGNLWFALEKKLLPGEIQEERDEIQKLFPKLSETYS
jgi:hypothetical protein